MEVIECPSCGGIGTEFSDLSICETCDGIGEIEI